MLRNLWSVFSQTETQNGLYSVVSSASFNVTEMPYKQLVTELPYNSTTVSGLLQKHKGKHTHTHTHTHPPSATSLAAVASFMCR